jgi:hypothetical protein
METQQFLVWKVEASMRVSRHLDVDILQTSQLKAEEAGICRPSIALIRKLAVCWIMFRRLTSSSRNLTSSCQCNVNAPIDLSRLVWGFFICIDFWFMEKIV